jgi:hypothetical protein
VGQLVAALAFVAKVHIKLKATRSRKARNSPGLSIFPGQGSILAMPRHDLVVSYSLRHKQRRNQISSLTGGFQCVWR